MDGFRSNQDQNDLLSQNDKIVQYRLFGNANFFCDITYNLSLTQNWNVILIERSYFMRRLLLIMVETKRSEVKVTGTKMYIVVKSGLIYKKTTTPK